MDLEALLAAIGTDEAPTDEELVEARAELVDLLEAAVDPESRDLEAARTLREQITAIDTETTRRVDAKASEDEEAAKLLEGVKVQEEEPAVEDDETAETDEPVEEVEAKELVGAKADVGKAIKAARSRIQDRPPVEEPKDVKVRGIGAAAGRISVDSTLDDVASVFNDLTTGKQAGRQDLVHMDFVYPEDRQLHSKSAVDNSRLIDAVFTLENMNADAVAAAGGICGPLAADFTHPICGTRGRPIRDSLARFNANRGGLRYAPSVGIGDVAAGTGVWTIETDESPGETVKECLVLDCEDELVVEVDAVYACVQIGNFQARFNPEFWRSRLDVLMIAHDELAEVTLYNDIVAGSTAVTYANTAGTIYGVLSFIDKAVAGMRSRNRLNNTIGFRAILPDWVHQALRADIASQRLNGQNGADSLAQADQIIDSFFRVRGVIPVWSLDVDQFGAQNAGALLDFPGADTPITIYPEGTWMFLDGGTLDLGTEITDSTLNQTNDRQAFMETFEKVAFRGCESLTTTIDVAELCVCSEVLEASSPA